MLMKKYLLFALFIGLNIAATLKVNAQCSPDPTCNDIGNPGEMCPEVLPPATANVPYSQVLTVIPPATFLYNGQTVSINKIKISNVENLPQGLSYQCNPSNCEFTPTTPVTRYCILLSGTATTPGTYPLRIHIIPYVTILGIPTALPEQVDDTSLVMVVNTASYAQIVNSSKFTLLPAQPNPYNATVNISYYSPYTTSVDLQVFDVLGNKVYEEKAISNKGENAFKFDGSNLKRGVYVYTVTNGRERFVKQLIKN